MAANTISDDNALAQQRVADLRDRISRLDDAGLDILFREARSHTDWTSKPVGDNLLKELYELTALGPTANNGCPMRLIFVRSPEGKGRLKPALSPGNLPKVEAAPVTAIIAFDAKWYELLPRMFAHNPEYSEKSVALFNADPASAEAAGFRNGTLQGAYFMLAARALGLDVGPMSGFQTSVVDAGFFVGTTYKTNFLCNIGYGDANGIFPRNPRFAFEEVCEVI